MPESVSQVRRVSLDVPLQGVTAETLGDGKWPLKCTDENHRDAVQRVAQALHTSGRRFDTVRAHRLTTRAHRFLEHFAVSRPGGA